MKLKSINKNYDISIESNGNQNWRIVPRRKHLFYCKHKIVKSIYNMMGPNHVAMDQFESPEARAKGIFARMDVNSDGKVTKTEFVRCCLEDQKLIELLTPMSAST